MEHKSTRVHKHFNKGDQSAWPAAFGNLTSQAFKERIAENI